MPSPVGHGLAGVVCGLLITRPLPAGNPRWIQVATLAAIAIAPDLDLIVDAHRGASHSVGAAAIAGGAAAAVRLPIARTRLRIGLAAFLAWVSHPLLDSFGHDNVLPLGGMVFWPLSTEYFITPWQIFEPITRRWWTWRFYVHNGLAVIREILILGPIAAAVWRWRSRSAVAMKASAGFPAELSGSDHLPQ